MRPPRFRGRREAVLAACSLLAIWTASSVQSAGTTTLEVHFVPQGGAATPAAAPPARPQPSPTPAAGDRRPLAPDAPRPSPPAAVSPSASPATAPVQLQGPATLGPSGTGGLELDLDNPLGVPVEVEAITLRVLGAAPLAGLLDPICGAIADLTATEPLSPPLLLPAHASRSLTELAGPNSPTLLGTLPVALGLCAGGTTLSVTYTATGVPAPS